jgi:hypothetical protein
VGEARRYRMAETVVRDAGTGVHEACAHHWVLETPSGAMSRGVCKRCGAEKEFPNSAEDRLWERDVPQSRWTGRSDPGF